MPDEDDEDLWSFVTRGVKPLKRLVSLTKNPSEGSAPKKVNKMPDVKKNPVLSPSFQPPLPQTAQHAGAGLDRKTAEKLRKGQMKIEARLDLHGFTQAQAHEALHDFILRTYSAGKRCVLVITGKGPGEDGRRDPLSKGHGVLKRMVPLWLDDSALKPLILKIEQARPNHGGEGALYVLLRRQR